MPTVRETLTKVRKALAGADCDGVEVETPMLVAHALGLTRTQLLTVGSRILTSDEAGRIQDFTNRRISHEPLAYILGWTEFYGRVFMVEPGVLIPRVDTEVVIDVALATLGESGEKNPRILELGIGSGCIICTILAELSAASGTGVELYPTPLKVSARNADAMSVARRLCVLPGSWYQPLPASARGTFNLIVANPPYVAESERDDLQQEVRDHEPREALFAGDGGLAMHRSILSGAPAWLCGNGHVIVEMGCGQQDAILKLAESLGYRKLTVHDDTAGIPRVLVAAL